MSAASPTRPWKAGLILPISAASMSMWAIVACGQNSATLPVARSSKRAPIASEQVGLLEQEIGALGGVHAEHAHEKRIIRRHGAEGHERAHHRRGQAVGERLREVRGAGRRSRRRRGRAPGAGRRRGDGASASIERVGAGRNGRRAAGLGPVAHLDRGVLDVLGHVDGHGSGPAGLRELEGQRHDLQQLGRMAHEEIVLGDRQGEPVGVDLLERVGADQRLRRPGR